MIRTQRGFTLIELMIVVVIIGILAAIGIPNFIIMQNRAREGSTKANMHTFQLAAEDWAVKREGKYGSAATVANFLPTNFKNPFDATSGSGNAWMSGTANKAGITGYTPNAADSTSGYVITGADGAAAPFVIALTNGS